MEYTALDKAMVKIYLRRINRGEIGVEDVPEKIRSLVQEQLGN